VLDICKRGLLFCRLSPTDLCPNVCRCPNIYRHALFFHLFAHLPPGLFSDLFIGILFFIHFFRLSSHLSFILSRRNDLPIALYKPGTFLLGSSTAPITQARGAWTIV
jgi:hypothetical protein